MEKIHHTVGVYANGEMKHNGVVASHLETHIAYNKFWRFGRALFVDGVCVYPGYLNEAEVKAAAEKIAKIPKLTRDTQPYH
jgi:hypothetical protein